MKKCLLHWIDIYHTVNKVSQTDFVTKEDFEWSCEETTKKKKTDFSKVEFLSDARKVSPEKLKTVIRHPIRER